MILTKISQISGKEQTMDLPITESEYYRAVRRWQGGEFIQTAFPLLKAEQREFIMTGITPEEWEEHITRPCEEEE